MTDRPTSESALESVLGGEQGEQLHLAGLGAFGWAAIDGLSVKSPHR